MKKIIFLSSILFVAFSFQVQAQYKYSKHNYSPKSYEYHYTDKYNPGLCAMASVAVPGLGQIVAGESLRGVAFLCAAVGASIITYTGIFMMEENSVYSLNF